MFPIMPHGLPAKRTTRTNSPRRHRSLQLEPLENRSLLATATLDSLFGDSGLVETPVPVNQGSLEHSQQLIQQSDGKLLALGTSGTWDRHLPIVTRLLADGTRDSSFGVNGVALLSREHGGSVSSIAVQSDGKILVAGYVDGPYVTRLNSNGSLDASFANAGYQRQLGSVGQIQSIIVQADGKLLVGGETWDGDFAVARLAPNGDVDLSYGQSGTGRVESPQPVQVFEIALQPDGQLIAAGMSPQAGEDALVVTRFTVDGQPDESFGQAGLHQVVVGPSFSTGWPTDTYDLTVGADGTIAVVGTPFDLGSTRPVPKVFVLTEDGLPQTTFSSDGIAEVALNEHAVSGGVSILADGSILVAGHVGPNSGASHHFLAKLTSQGVLDAGWASAGYTTSDLSLSFDLVTDLLVSADGSIFTLVEIWTEGNYSDLGVAKWLPNGALNSMFNGSGVSTINVARPISYVSVDQLLPHPSGGMVLLGQSGFWAEQVTAAIYYSADGQIDASPTKAGIQRFTWALPFGRGTLQPDGKLVLAMTEDLGNGWRVYPTRYLADGTVDPTFSVPRTGIERPGSFHAQHVLAQADGKIVVIAIDLNFRGLNTLTRYLPDGQVDQSFGIGGVLELDGLYGQVISAVEQEGAIFLLTGGFNFDAAPDAWRVQRQLLRVDPAGRLDTTFGGMGAIAVDDETSSDGKLLLDGRQRLIAVTATVAKRFLLDGTPDASFGDEGTVAMPSGYAAPPGFQGAAANASGHLFVTRRFNYPHETDRQFVRLNADGSTDAEFSTQASAIIRSHGFIDYPGLLVRGNEITVAGRVQEGLENNFQLIRIQSGEHAAWRNPTNPLNVDNDPTGAIVPLDALLIINQLNLIGPYEFTPAGPASGDEVYYDVNGDNYLSAIDALIIINYLNANPIAPAGQGEGIAAESGEADAAFSETGGLSATDASLASSGLSDEALAGLLWGVENDRERRGR